MPGKPLAPQNFPQDIFDPPEIPERNLLAATLSRAIADVLNPSQSEGGKSPESQKHCRSACFWLRNVSKEPFSFCWVCQYLDLEPKRVRRLIYEFKANGIRFDLVRNRVTGD